MVSRYSLRLYVITLVMIGGFAALCMRLWILQVKRQHEFAALVPGTSIVTQRVPGVRGEIKDRNGITLASNRAAFEVSLNLADIEAEYRRLNKTVPKFQYTVGGRTREESDIVAIVKEVVLQPLETKGLDAGVNATQLRVHYRSKKDVIPFRYRQDLTFQEFATFAEYNLGLPGVHVSVRPVREYPFGSLACHILGYVREAEDVVPDDEKGRYNYYVGDDTGLAGVEKSMNAELKGTPGVRELLKNEKGVLTGEAGYKEPRPGSSVFLTIDARMQYIVERILREAGVGRACAVIIKPTTGEILAMASVPSYDPNSFIPSISQHEWDAYTSNKTLPFQNRTTAASPPGSTFKLVTALSAALAGVDDKRLYCDGGQGYGKFWMKCWISNQGGSHGSLDVSNALKSSCNDFFYQQGNLAGIDKIVTVGRLLGLGEPTGVPLDGEGGGLLPTPEWLRMYGRRQWGSADTAQVSIGQGAMSATPLQMCNVTATIANRGLCFIPRLISTVVDADGEEERKPSVLKADLTREGITVDQIEKIRHGMWLVVNDGGGTARRAYSAKHPTAGKTGSATVPKIIVNGEEREDTHAWFVSFAPYDEPEISVCVRVEGGKAGGKVAAPIAAEIIARVLALDDGYKLRMRPMPEAHGNFDFFDEITFGGDGGAFDDAGMDEATDLEDMIDQAVEVPENEQSESEPAQPRIQPAVDEQGKVEPTTDSEQ
ncbi:MAG: penicillin-binding protein 2 [Verrucomicrobiae bacterium]|nr:penicillin-binding protein 2 [Verrucomicrobiae bacterium]